MLNVIRKGALEYLVADNIDIPHGFTTRLGGVSRGPLSSLNLGMNRGDNPENVVENYRILTDAMGCTSADVVMTNQTHSDIVRVVTREEAGKSLDHRDWPECDAIITRDPGVALVVFTADCTPVLLHDPVTGAVGAVHAGWRGTAKDLAGKTVREMVAAFGCRPEHICAAIGPNIARCCFETDRDVPAAMLDAYGKAALALIRPTGNKYYVNLKELNALSLSRAGVTKIRIGRECTCCERERFWSHRIHGAARGSQGAIIVCKGVTP